MTLRERAKRNAAPATAGFVVLRTPLLPFDELLAWGEGLRAPNAEASALEEAVAADEVLVRARLRDRMARPELREALFVASPQLLERHDGDLVDEKRGKAELALARYFLRMCGRATPFGLFAGCTVGDVGETTSLALRARSEYRRHTRLDNDFLFALVDRLERSPEMAKTLRFTPNSSLYPIARSLRYAEVRLEGKQRTYHLVAVDRTEYLEGTLERARDATIAELADALADADSDITIDEAESFVRELVDSQILVSDLAPGITGREPIEDLLDRLSRHPAAELVRRRLLECRTALAELDESGVGNETERYLAIARTLESLSIPIEPARLFQVDLVTAGDSVVLGSEPLDEILRSVDVYHRLFGFGGEPHAALERFRNAFLARYETREVPLVEALDEDVGIEFHMVGRSSGRAPLLEGLGFPSAEAVASEWSHTQRLLYRKLVETLAAGGEEIVLTPEDLEDLDQGGRPELPESFAVQAAICAASPEAVARGEFRVTLTNVVGPSGAIFLGRFCHGDPELRRRVERHLRDEEANHPEMVYAEIVHLPEGRVGNVIVRPVLRAYEIPYLGRSSEPAERQIPITDLMLSISGDRFVLRSAALEREVIPRMSNAHNFGPASLPIYRFLAALQQQNLPPWLMWNWGPLASAGRLPRVRFGRTVLVGARWRLSKEECIRMRAASASDRYRWVQRWRSEQAVPRFVLVAEGDNRLPIDLDNVLGVDVLVDLVARHSGTMLEEMIPGPEELLARGPEGRYLHELIVPFLRPRAEAVTVRAPSRRHLQIARRFAPGSEWLYLKLYASAAHADPLLRAVVGPVAREAVANGKADQWFFVRYSDPEKHLRVRLHGPPGSLWHEVYPAFERALASPREQGILWRVQLDTYEREVERYGGDAGIGFAERLFFADSEAVLDLLNELSGDAGSELRWRIALLGIDRLLDDFGLATDAKRHAAGALRDALGNAVHADKALHVQLGEKFRKERAGIERALSGDGAGQASLQAALRILRLRSERMASAVADLLGAGRERSLSTDLTSVLSSLVHMHMNRLLRSDHQPQEYVLYDFLERLYESRSARERRRGSPMKPAFGDLVSVPAG
jgi:lantibiotic biosynthesis protein